MENFQVFIPKPCTENWNQMTQQEKGRFCGKCSKSVVDFSNMSMDEIKDYFLSHKGDKICGHFKSDQINKPVILKLSFPQFHSRISSLQIFYLSFLIIFGTTFFSCTNHKDELINQYEVTNNFVENSEFAIHTEQKIEKDELSKSKNDDTNNVNRNKSQSTSRDTSLLDTIIDLRAVDIDAKEIRLVDGGTRAIFCFSYETNCQWEHDYDTIYNESQTSDESILIEQLNVYPNPADEYVNLKIILSGQTNIKADLFDLNGRLIRNLIPVESTDGEFIQQIDIQDLKPATYLIRFVNGNKIETKRLIVM